MLTCERRIAAKVTLTRQEDELEMEKLMKIRFGLETNRGETEGWWILEKSMLTLELQLRGKKGKTTENIYGGYAELV